MMKNLSNNSQNKLSMKFLKFIEFMIVTISHEMNFLRINLFTYNLLY